MGKAHKAAGFSSPIQDSVLIAEMLKGTKRTHGTASKQKAPVLTEDLRLMLRLIPHNLQGTRDRAILLAAGGINGDFRRTFRNTDAAFIVAIRRAPVMTAPKPPWLHTA